MFNYCPKCLISTDSFDPHNILIYYYHHLDFTDKELNT